MVGPQPSCRPRHQATPADGQHDDVRHGTKLLDRLRDRRALPRGGARIVERGDDGASGLRGESRGGLRGLIVGGALHHELSVPAPQRVDAIPFLAGRGGGHVDHGADA